MVEKNIVIEIGKKFFVFTLSLTFILWSVLYVFVFTSQDLQAATLLANQTSTTAGTAPGTWGAIPDMTSTVSVTGPGSVLILSFAMQQDPAADNTAEYRFAVDGVRQGPQLTQFCDDTLNDSCMGSGLIYAVTGLSAGSHTFSVEWQNILGTVNTDTTRTRSFQVMEIESGANILVDIESTTGATVPNNWADVPDLNGTGSVTGAGSILLLLAGVQPRLEGDRMADFHFAVDGNRDGPQMLGSGDAGNAANGLPMAWAETGLSAGSHTFSLQWQKVAGKLKLDSTGRPRTFQVIEFTSSTNLLADIESSTSGTAPGVWGTVPDFTASPSVSGPNSVVLMLANLTQPPDANDKTANFRMGIDGVREGPQVINFNDEIDVNTSTFLPWFRTGLSAGTHTFTTQWQNIAGSPTLDTTRARTFQVIEWVGVVADTVTVTATGTQTPNATIPSTNNYGGGTFAISRTLGGSTNLTSIAISETDATLNADTDLTNAKLEYDLDTTAPYDCASVSRDGDELTFDSGVIFSSQKATFTNAGVAISATQTFCGYLVFDVDAGASSDTAEFEISGTGDVVDSGASSILGTPATMAGGTQLRAGVGTIMSEEIDFDWVPGQTSWGEVVWSTTETEGDVKLKVYYSASSACDTIVPDAVLSGNSTGFDVTESPLDISGLVPATYNRICLEAILTAGATASPTLDDWRVTWVTPVGDVIDISPAGTQIVNVGIGATSVYIGGNFVISNPSLNPATVTGIRITEQGTVDAQANLSNITLRYGVDTTTPFDCASESYSASDTLFDPSPQSFNGANGYADFTGSVVIDDANTLCVYVELDVESGAAPGETIEIEISAGSDVTVTESTRRSGSFPVEISGTTVVLAGTATVMSEEIDFDWVPGQGAWGEVLWSTSEPGNSDVRLQIYYSSASACDTIVPNAVLPGNANGFDATVSPLSIAGLDTSTYNRICLKATLTARTVSPILHYWIVTWEAPVFGFTGTYISSSFDSGGPSVFNVIEWIWSKSDISCIACNIRFQIQTAPDAGGIPGAWSATWSGPQGEDGDETDYFEIPSGELIHTDHNGDQWIRYRATLDGDGSATPVLEEVRVYYK